MNMWPADICTGRCTRQLCRWPVHCKAQPGRSGGPTSKQRPGRDDLSLQAGFSCFSQAEQLT